MKLFIIFAFEGVQAQTIANYFLAFEAGIDIIPVINKIDLKTAKVEQTVEQITKTLGKFKLVLNMGKS